MPGPDGRILVAAGGDVVYGRVEGVGSQRNCYGLREYAREAREQGFRRFFLDLQACNGMDSTFIGVIIEIAMGDGDSPPSEVVLANASDRVRRSLEDVGVHRVTTMRAEAWPDPGLSLQSLPNPPVTPTERAHVMLRVHRRLLQLDPANREKFEAFVELLSRELGEQPFPIEED